MIFECLWNAAKKNELILVDFGMCDYHLRKDGQLTIREIIVLPQHQKEGIGTKMLNVLIDKNPKSIYAKCPADLSSNEWYKAKGFTLEKVEQTKTGRKINCWRLTLQESNQLELF